MENPDHLAVLKQGVAAWNQWRADNPDILPDLANAEPSKTNRTEAEGGTVTFPKGSLGVPPIAAANLRGANLSGANRTVLFPIRLDDSVMDIKTVWDGYPPHDRNIGDFRNWKDRDACQKAVARLLRDLETS